MQYFWLIVVVLLVSFQNIARKQYNTKIQTPNAFFFSAVTTLFALLFFVVMTKGQFSFDAGLLPYSVGFAIAHGSASIGMFLAIKYGSLSITMLVTSYSLIIPTFYGIFALGDQLGKEGYVGLALLFISLFLINFQKETAQQKISLKWIIFLAISFVGNGMCSTVQKMQQLKFNEGYKNEFMIIALAISTTVLFIASLYDRKSIKLEFLRSIPFGGFTGIANGVTNYLVMVLSAPGVIPVALLFPTISAGGIVIGFITSITIYKERLSKIQLVGYAMGVISVVLLNL